MLPPDEHKSREDEDSFSDDSDDVEQSDPSAKWSELHKQIKSTIAELGGKVTPKLNWSAPKDASWMSATNDLECRSANDVYLLLKSSDFVTHDLEHAFDGCVSDGEIPYHLVLRKYVNFNPSLEFRCFVRNRVLLCLCQRDQNYFDFLLPMREALRDRIQAFFDEKLRDTFPDDNFVFDVYVPPPHQRVWLVDVNPWAERTDPLLFSWMEILNMKEPVRIEDEIVRLSVNGNGEMTIENDDDAECEEDDDGESDCDEVSELFPEFRLIKRDDPEAYAFTTSQYSAHKLPKEVVDASLAGPGGMQDFLGRWQDILSKNIQGVDQESDSEGDEE